MRIPSSHRHDDAEDDKTMTPLIDVVFQLLIFFVCASVGQLRESLLPTELAAGALASDTLIEREKPLGEVWLRLRRGEAGQTIVEINDRVIDDRTGLKELLTSLAHEAPEIPVILDIAPDVPMSDLIDVYDTCRAVRFQSIHFAVDPAARSSITGRPNR